jgi:hypothetical protein
VAEPFDAGHEQDVHCGEVPEFHANVCRTVGVGAPWMGSQWRVAAVAVALLITSDAAWVSAACLVSGVARASG